MKKLLVGAMLIISSMVAKGEVIKIEDKGAYKQVTTCIDTKSHSTSKVVSSKSKYEMRNKQDIMKELKIEKAIFGLVENHTEKNKDGNYVVFYTYIVK